jgi:type IV pilus biogenesis protein CpaD/CtpE
VSAERRPEVLSLRISAEEKRRLMEAASRERALAEATGRPTKSLSEWARDQLLKHADDPAVWPAQTIKIQAPSTGANDDRLLVARIRRYLAHNGESL